MCKVLPASSMPTAGRAFTQDARNDDPSGIRDITGAPPTLRVRTGVNF
jgi:hypothetical protein